MIEYRPALARLWRLFLSLGCRAKVGMGIIAFELVSSIVFAFLSIRALLLSPGYYTYADQTWPVVPYLPSSDIFVGSIVFTSGRVTPNYIFQLTRDIVSWPWIPISLFGPSYAWSEKLFLLYSFFLFFIAAWITAAIVTRTFEQVQGNRLRLFRKESFKLLVVMLLSTNLVSIQFNVDGGTLADGLILMITVSLAALIIRKSKWTVRALEVGVLISIILLLDPDYYLSGLLVVFFIAVVSGVLQGNLTDKLRGSFAGFTFSLPVLAFTLYGLNMTAWPAGPSSYRSVSLAAGWLSNNTNPLSTLLLTSYGWSTLTYAPPGILGQGSSLSQLPVLGNPTVIVLPPGLLTALWLVSLATLPLMTFVPIIWVKARRTALPLASLALFGMLLAQYPHIPVMLALFVRLGNLPHIGFAFSTAVAVPDHFLMIVVTAYIVAASLMLFMLVLPSEQRKALPEGRGFELVLSWRKRNSPESRTDSSSWRAYRCIYFRLFSLKVRLLVAPRSVEDFKAFLAVALTVMVIFGGWQAFNGSFFPARAGASTFAGNGVPDTGAFSPIDVSQEALGAYNYMFSNGTNFNVYWPIGDGIGLYGQRVNLPSVSFPGIQYLLANNLSDDLAYYASTHGVRYIVLQNASGVKQPNGFPSPEAAQNPYLYYFGLASFQSVETTLANASGLSLGYSSKSLDVYSVNAHPSLFYNASLLLTVPSESGFFATSYQFFRDLGDPVALTSESTIGESVGRGLSMNQVQPIGIATPQNISEAWISDHPSNLTAPLNVSVTNVTPGVSYYSNSTSVRSNRSWTQNNTMGEYNVDIGGFDFTDWKGTASIVEANGVISMYSKRGADFTLNMGGPVTPYPPLGIRLPSLSGTLGASLRASFTDSTNRSTGIVAAMVASTDSGSKTTAFDQFLPVGTGGAYEVSASTTIPSASQYFTFRLGGGLHGIF